MKNVSQLSVMDRMVKADNKGIALSTTLISTEKVPQGRIAGFGLEESIGKHAELYTLGLPQDYMFMCFAVKRQEFEITKQLIEKEDSENSDLKLIEEGLTALNVLSTLLETLKFTEGLTVAKQMIERYEARLS